jgi:hypothetical protein
VVAELLRVGPPSGSFDGSNTLHLAAFGPLGAAAGALPAGVATRDMSRESTDTDAGVPSAVGAPMGLSASSASGVALCLLALLSVLAMSPGRLSARLRSCSDLWRPAVFIALLERPG